VARERTPLNGYVHIKAWEKQADGSEKLIKDDTIKNLVVTVGKDAILKFLGNRYYISIKNFICLI